MIKSITKIALIIAVTVLVIGVVGCAKETPQPAQMVRNVVEIYLDVFEKRAAGIINPGIAHAGGILETKKLADMAHAYYVTFAPHGGDGPVAMACQHSSLYSFGRCGN